MTGPKNSPDEANLDGPEKLLSAFRRPTLEPVFVPSTLDEAILRAARKHLSRPESPRFKWLPLLPWFAAAAAMIVAGALLFFHSQPRSNISNPPAFARQDINHDGRVDILDAFALAKRLKQGTVSDLRLDVNGDGIVDERDMQIIASEAVKVNKGGRS